MSDTTTEEKKEVEVPAKFKDLVSSIESLTVLDLAELVKVLEEKFGVSAAAPMAMMAAPAAGGDAGAGEEEVSEVNVELTSAGAKKIDVIKAVRSLMDVGLKDAKDMVDAAPKIIKEGVAKAVAEQWKKTLEEAGATVSFK
ncbi:MAG: 50S ribosomal protein L7/L12 [bacterium]|nr:50S ribosomal protein L7/L12 [bacterium]